MAAATTTTTLMATAATTLGTHDAILCPCTSRGKDEQGRERLDAHLLACGDTIIFILRCIHKNTSPKRTDAPLFVTVDRTHAHDALEGQTQLPPNRRQIVAVAATCGRIV
jgi:hypothetical protein